ncbi:MAG: Arc family DNA-binding protein [Kiloniellales bacterium]
MPVNLSIKNAPDDIVRRLKRRAEKHHRSLQGELLAILEEAVRSPHAMSCRDVLAEVARLGVRTPRESASMIRKDRDGRFR